MSAWYLFSAIGLYPAVPGTGELLLHAPRYERITLDLANGKQLTLEAPGADGSKLQYVQGVSVDGRRHDQVWLDWNTLREGGTVHFELGATPPTSGWGTSPNALPKSLCATPG
jgi:putative alpha-1,2-mannosidase